MLPPTASPSPSPSLDGGRTWEARLASDSQTRWVDVVVSRDGRRATIAQENGRLFVSSDEGLRTWLPKEAARDWSTLAMC